MASEMTSIGDQKELLRSAIMSALPDIPLDAVDLFFTALGKSTDELVQGAAIVLEKPYGRNHILLTASDFALSFACLEVGRSTSFHYHDHRREFFLARQGKLRLTTPDGITMLDTGEWASSTPGVAHSIANGGTERLELLELFAPPLLDDKCRLSDPYDRNIGKVTFRE